MNGSGQRQWPEKDSRQTSGLFALFTFTKAHRVAIQPTDTGTLSSAEQRQTSLQSFQMTHLADRLPAPWHGTLTRSLTFGPLFPQVLRLLLATHSLYAHDTCRVAIISSKWAHSTLLQIQREVFVYLLTVGRWCTTAN